MPTIITMDNVYRIFRMGQERIYAVNGISLDIEEGEICCLQGPSGSGKSTLLHMMAGLDKPSKGSITIGKTRIDRLSENQLALFRQKYIGFIFKATTLYQLSPRWKMSPCPLLSAACPGPKETSWQKSYWRL